MKSVISWYPYCLQMFCVHNEAGFDDMLQCSIALCKVFNRVWVPPSGLWSLLDSELLSENEALAMS